MQQGSAISNIYVKNEQKKMNAQNNLNEDFDKETIVNNNFIINENISLPLNSSATNIFIDNTTGRNCLIDVNPEDTEFLTIPNKSGTKDKSILIIKDER